MEEAYIYDTVRSPRGKGKKGSLNEISAVTLSAKILEELRERNSLNTEEIEDVIWGNVTQVGEQGGCLARSAVIAANYSESCLLYTSPSPRDGLLSRMPSSA